MNIDLHFINNTKQIDAIMQVAHAAIIAQEQQSAKRSVLSKYEIYFAVNMDLLGKQHVNGELLDLLNKASIGRLVAPLGFGSVMNPSGSVAYWKYILPIGLEEVSDLTGKIFDLFQVTVLDRLIAQ